MFRDAAMVMLFMFGVLIAAAGCITSLICMVGHLWWYAPLGLPVTYIGFVLAIAMLESY